MGYTQIPARTKKRTDPKVDPSMERWMDPASLSRFIRHKREGGEVKEGVYS